MRCQKSDRLLWMISFLIVLPIAVRTQVISYRLAKACKLGHPLPSRNLKVREKCCDYVDREYAKNWYRVQIHLSTHLQTLKEWNCQEFQKQCSNRKYALTPFSKKMYKRFCNESQFREECWESIGGDDVNKPNLISDQAWKKLLMGLQNLSTYADRFRDSCTQVAVYDLPGFYYEIINVLVPFCGFVWCGMNYEVASCTEVSTWTCLPNRCRVNLIIIEVVCIVVSLLVIAANIIVIAVFAKSKKLNNSQAVFKISIACADLLVGAVVLPSFVSTIYLFMLNTNPAKNISTVPEIFNETYLDSDASQTNSEHSLYPAEKAPPFYFNLVGIFTVLSFTSSIYSLMAAGVDRLVVITQPMVYFKRDTKRIARYLVVSIWCLALLFSCLPLFNTSDGLEYTVVASMLICLSGKDALIIYAIALILPLLVTWISSLTLYISMKRQGCESEKAATKSGGLSQCELERKLANTLGLMVGVFTLSLAPAIAVFIGGLLAKHVQYKNAEDLNETSSSVFVSAEFVSVLILVMNSLWNCLIYSVRNADFRSEAKELFRPSSRKRELIGTLPKPTQDNSKDIYKSAMPNILRIFSKIKPSENVRKKSIGSSSNTCTCSQTWAQNI